MRGEPAREDERVDALLQHAHLQRLHAAEHLEGLVRVEESALHVIDVPEERAVPAGVALGDEHVGVAPDDDAGGRVAVADEILRVAVDDEIRPRGGVGLLQRAHEEGRADGGVEHHGEAGGVGGPADGGHVEEVAVRVAGAFEVNVDAPTLREPAGVFGLRRGEGPREVVRGHAVEELHADVEVGFLGEPVVEQLVGAAVNVARGQDDVAVADKVGEDAVDGGHAGVEVPREVFRRHRAGLDIHDVVGEGDRGGVEQARVNLVQELAALEGVVDPLGAREDVGGRAGDDGVGGKDGRDVVEGRVGPLGERGGGGVAQRLVDGAGGVLQGVEQLRQLESEELLRIEKRHAVGLWQPGERARGGGPEFVEVAVRGVEPAGEAEERRADG